MLPLRPGGGEGGNADLPSPFAKYSPAQPRIAAGQTGAGRWTSGGGGIAAPGRADRLISVAADAPRLAQGPEEENREKEEPADPMAEVRVAEFRSKMDLLRQLDPANPNLSYISKPDYVPSQADLDSLDAAIQTAAIKRVTDFVMPGGKPIGTQGGGSRIRKLPGGLDAAIAAFNYLRVGGTVVDDPSYPGTLARLPGNAGFVGFRPTSTSGPPGVDLNVSGVPYRTLHYLESK